MQKSKLNMGFVYNFNCYDTNRVLQWSETVKNIIPDVGVAYILDAALAGGSQVSSWYIGLYEGVYTPVAGATMTDAVTTASESIVYSGGTRIAMVPDAISGGVFSDTSSPAEFTFTDAATIRGGFITSNSVRANTSGVLLSMVALSSARVVESGFVLEVTSGLSFTSV